MFLLPLQTYIAALGYMLSQWSSVRIVFCFVITLYDLQVYLVKCDTTTYVPHLTFFSQAFSRWFYG